MEAAMDDQSVAQRVLDHIANGTTDVGQEVWREPVANYRSEERLAAEIEVTTFPEPQLLGIKIDQVVAAPAVLELPREALSLVKIAW